MNPAFQSHIQKVLADIEAAGLFKQERALLTPQGAHVSVAAAVAPEQAGERKVLNFCANNYLGLSAHPDLVRAAHAALDRWGYGLSSVRFICGTQQVHRELEDKLSAFLATDDTILYSSCFDANGGVFETLLSAEDAVISDELNQPRCWSGPSKYSTRPRSAHTRVHASRNAGCVVCVARCVQPESNHTSRMSVSFLNGPEAPQPGHRKPGGTKRSTGSSYHESEPCSRV